LRGTPGSFAFARETGILRAFSAQDDNGRSLCDYGVLARVATLARDFAVAIANLDQRPALDGARQSDPHAPCRQ